MATAREHHASSNLEPPFYPKHASSNTSALLPFHTSSTSVESASDLHKQPFPSFRSFRAALKNTREISTIQSYLNRHDFTEMVLLQSAIGTLTHTAFPVDRFNLKKCATLSPPNEFLMVRNRLRSLEDQHNTNASLVTALRMELEHANHRVQELEFTQKLAHKEIDNLLRNVAEERITVHTKQKQSAKAAIQCLKSEIEEEKKARKKLEMLNRRLARDISELKRALARAANEVAREKKARKLMEDVYHELAKEIGQDKADFQQLKRRHGKARDLVDEERKMLQLAGAWKEKVQRKLVQASLELQENYKALHKLKSKLESFLDTDRTTGSKDNGLQEEEIKQAEMLLEAVALLNLHESQDSSFFVAASNEACATGNGLPVELHKCLDGRPCYDSHSLSGRHAGSRTFKPDVYGESQLDEGAGTDDEYHLQSDIEADASREGECRRKGENACACKEVDEIHEGNSFDNVIQGEDADISSDYSEGFHNKKRESRMNNECKRSSQSTWGMNSDAGTSFMAAKNKNRERLKGCQNREIRSEAAFAPLQIHPSRLENSGPKSQKYSHDAGDLARGINSVAECHASRFRRNSLQAKLLEARMESQNTHLKHTMIEYKD